MISYSGVIILQNIQILTKTTLIETKRWRIHCNKEKYVENNKINKNKWKINGNNLKTESNINNLPIINTYAPRRGYEINHLNK